ncbi:transposase [Streptomyces roseolus]|uniref:transposase n=1 Tax=Streptomyces roseolus TaxID=67358 RepID=UPI001672E1D1|nr:hypothetical protein GCM10010282_67250 [Streptomyces roseolus]
MRGRLPHPHENGAPTPVDRRKTGSKHHLICDGRGTPFKVITTAANVNDVTQTLALVDGIPPVAGRPGRPSRRPEALLGDKGHDSNPNRRELCKRRILPVISRKGAPNIQDLRAVPQTLDGLRPGEPRIPASLQQGTCGSLPTCHGNSKSTQVATTPSCSTTPCLTTPGLWN